MEVVFARVLGDFTYFFVLRMGYTFSAICTYTCVLICVRNVSHRVELIARKHLRTGRITQFDQLSPTVQARNPLM